MDKETIDLFLPVTHGKIYQDSSKKDIFEAIYEEIWGVKPSNNKGHCTIIPYSGDASKIDEGFDVSSKNDEKVYDTWVDKTRDKKTSGCYSLMLTTGKECPFNIRIFSDTQNAGTSESVAGILFSDKLANGLPMREDNYSVLAIMGGALPLSRKIFRWSISASLKGGVTSRLIADEALALDKAKPYTLLISYDDENVLGKACAKAFLGYGDSFKIDHRIIVSEDGKQIDYDQKQNDYDQKQKETISSGVKKFLEETPQENVVVGIMVQGHWAKYQEIINEIFSATKELHDNVKAVTLYVDADYFRKVKEDEEKPDKGKLGCETRNIRVECLVARKLDALGNDLSDKIVKIDTFAREAIKLCKKGVEYVRRGDLREEADKRGRFRRFLKSCKFYQTSFGSIFFRDDGELFLPLYRYSKEIEEQATNSRWGYKGPFIERDSAVRTNPNVPRDLLFVTNLLTKIDAHINDFQANRIDQTDDAGLDSLVEKLLKECADDINVTFSPEEDPGCLKFISLADNKVSKDCLGTSRVSEVQAQEATNDLHGLGALARAYEGLADKVAEFDRSILPIQIDVHHKDINDNDAMRCYLLKQDDKIIPACDVTPKDLQLESGVVKAIVLSQSQGYAERVLVNHKKEIDERIDSLSPSTNLALGDSFVRSSLVVCKMGTDALASFGNMIRASRKAGAHFLYCILAANANSEKQGCLVMFSKTKLNLFELQILKNCVSRIFQTIDSAFRRQRILKANAKIAIGSIMSRNGSHNIGSHVLSALSCHPEKSPEDQIFYRYIQHRLDFIATMATEFPRWTQPTMFVGGMMRTFLSQSLLLDHITESEGLHAWSCDQNGKSQTNCLRFHIQRKNDRGTIEFTHYNEDGSLELTSLQHDVELAIPGGAVGQHAFFTILENIVRNAAKYEWASSKKRYENLDVYICFNEDEEDVEFHITTNVSQNVQNAPNECNVADELCKKLDAELVLQDGKLVKQNWGLAEMRISAGSLGGWEPRAICQSQSCQIEGMRKIIVARESDVVINGAKNEKVWEYNFRIPKPKKLLIVIGDGESLGEDKLTRLAKKGICVKRLGALDSCGASTEFVVVDACSPELAEKLPFRVICMSDSSWDMGERIACWRNIESPMDIRSATSVRELLNYMDANQDWDKVLLKNVADCWRRHVIHRRNFNRVLLRVSPYGHDVQLDCNRSFVLSIVAYVLKNDFDKTVDEYKHQMSKGMTASDKCVLSVLQNHQRGLSRSLGKDCKTDYKSLIREQFLIWLETSQDQACKAKADALRRKKEILQREIDEKVVYRNKCEIGSNDYEKCQDEIADLLDRRDRLSEQEDCVGLPESMEKLIEDLAFACNERERDLRARKEKGGGLLSVDFDHSAGNCTGNEKGAMEVELDGCGTLAEDDHKALLLFERHLASSQICCAIPENSRLVYAESLSGSQLYLAQLQEMIELDQDDSRSRMLQTKLVECALLRILIIDERVSHYVKSHPEASETFARLNISVLDESNATAGIPNDKSCVSGALLTLPPQALDGLRHAVGQCKNEDAFRDAIVGLRNWVSELPHYDVLIIHQGIVDRWFPKLTHDSKLMTCFYKVLRKPFTYLIITTGRGRPATIPDRARILPFSTLEETLLKEHPEKLLLVDSIMNILPIGPDRK